MAKPFSEAKERTAFVESARTQAIEFLQVPEVQQRVGPLGDELRDLIEKNLYAPNNTGSLFTLPKSKVDTEAIPVIAVRPDESIQLQGLAMTPMQRQRAHSLLDSFPFDISSVEEFVAESEVLHASVEGMSRYISRMKSTCDGITSEYMQYVQMRFRHNLSVSGRPLILLKYTPEAQRTTGPITLIHEASHVNLNLKVPVRFIRRSRQARLDVANEAVSYGLEGAVAAGLTEHGTYRPRDPAAFNHIVKRAAYVDSLIPQMIDEKTQEVRIPRSVMRAMAQFVDVLR
jgi:hypothetical protein